MDKKVIVPFGKLGAKQPKDEAPAEVKFDFDKDDFYKQLKDFADEDHLTAWENVELKNHLYHIRIFVYKPEGYKKSSLLMQDYDGSITNIKDTTIARDFTHMAKVIQVGELIDKPSYAVGDLLMLDKYEVTGHSFSPEYLQIEQYANAYNMKPKVPEGVTKTVEAVQGHWKNFAMVLPEDYAIPADQIYNYAIGSGKIKAKYNL